MSDCAKNEPSFDREHVPLVATIVYDQLCTFEYGISTELFALHREGFERPLFDHITVAAEEKTITATGGLSFTADYGLEGLASADIVVLPGWRSVHDIPPASLLHALTSAHYRGAIIVTICSGVFALAATGLLDGKSATTHWRYTELLAKRFPQINVEPNVLYVDEGSLLTSAGSAAGLDLGLHLISRIYGQKIANFIARNLVLPAQRSGGQAQFIPHPTLCERTNEMGALLDQLRNQLREPWTVETIASTANLSPRTLLRRFQTHTGLSPINWLKQERLNVASELLESTDLNIDQVAHEAGFTAPEIFRMHFKKRFHTSPSQYRNHYRSGVQ